MLENFTKSIRSPVTASRADGHINAYARHYFFYEETDGKVVYRYDLLLQDGTVNIEEKLKHFVIYKKKNGLCGTGRPGRSGTRSGIATRVYTKNCQSARGGIG